MVDYMSQAHFFVHDSLSRRALWSLISWEVAVLPTPAELVWLPCFGLISESSVVLWLLRVRQDWQGSLPGHRGIAFSGVYLLSLFTLLCLAQFSLSDTLNMVVSFFCPLGSVPDGFLEFPLCLAGREFNSLIYSWEGFFDKHHTLNSSLRKCLLHFYLSQILFQLLRDYCCAQSKTTIFMGLHCSEKK